MLGKVPVFGICLGHQVLGLALGGMYLASTQGEVLNPGEALAQPGVDAAASAVSAAVEQGVPAAWPPDGAEVAAPRRRHGPW